MSTVVVLICMLTHGTILVIAGVTTRATRVPCAGTPHIGITSVIRHLNSGGGGEIIQYVGFLLHRYRLRIIKEIGYVQYCAIAPSFAGVGRIW